MNMDEVQKLDDLISALDEDWEGLGMDGTGTFFALEYERMVDGISVMSLNEPDQNYYPDVIGAQACYVRVVLKDGEIIYLSARGIFELTEPMEAEILSEEDAVKLVEEEKQLILSDDTWVFQNAYLEYVPIPEWSDSNNNPVMLIPYWLIVGERDGNTESVRINAITGGDLAYAE